ncbi:MAG: hypothetical protein JO336_18665 [Acidobacteriia bacterium]|nr:hypothetical protein [Terriglobia bacterium]
MFRKTGVWPHAVFSGHAHVYARFTRQLGGTQVVYVTAGNGGYATHFRAEALPAGSRLDLPDDHVTVSSYDSDHFGYLRVSVDKADLRIEYHPVSSELGSTKSMPIGDAVTVDLKNHRVAE